MSLAGCKILLIDDHVLIREGIQRALENSGAHLISHAASRNEAFAQIAHINPDVIIVDLNLPDGHGMEIISWARQNSNTIAIIVLTLSDDPRMIKVAKAAGASAFVFKSAPLAELLAAIESAQRSPLYFSSPQVLENGDASEVLLSPREVQILDAMNSELKYSQIATKYFVSEATIKSHVASIFAKLEVNSRIGAITKARSIGLL